MEWVAHLDSGSSISSAIITLTELLKEHRGHISTFYWYDSSGMRLGCKIPPGCEIVVFKRNYISTNGDKNAVFVLGWKPTTLQGAGSKTFAFLQPNGLVEVSDDQEYTTTFERSLN